MSKSPIQKLCKAFSSNLDLLKNDEIHAGIIEMAWEMASCRLEKARRMDNKLNGLYRNAVKCVPDTRETRLLWFSGQICGLMALFQARIGTAQIKKARAKRRKKVAQKKR